jgi:hypothetical protein
MCRALQDRATIVPESAAESSRKHGDFLDGADKDHCLGDRLSHTLGTCSNGAPAGISGSRLMLAAKAAISCPLGAAVDESMSSASTSA